MCASWRSELAGTNRPESEEHHEHVETDVIVPELCSVMERDVRRGTKQGRKHFPALPRQQAQYA